MTTTEILREINKLPLVERRNIYRQLDDDLHQENVSPEELREREFEQMLLAEGVISQIPARLNDDEEDDYEPIEIIGKPLSETIIEERGE